MLPVLGDTEKSPVHVCAIPYWQFGSKTAAAMLTAKLINIEKISMLNMTGMNCSIEQ